MPTTLPSSTMGTRLMAFLSSRFAMVDSGVSEAAVTTFRVITSVTRRECSLTNSLASVSRPVKMASHHGRLRPVPASTRRIRSPSLTIPSSLPSDPTTGTPLMRESNNVLNAGVRPYRNDIRHHHIGGFHGTGSILGSARTLLRWPADSLICIKTGKHLPWLVHRAETATGRWTCEDRTLGLQR